MNPNLPENEIHIVIQASELIHNEAIQKLLDFKTHPTMFTPETFNEEIEKIKSVELNPIQVIRKFSSECNEEFVRGCPVETLEMILEETITDEGLYYDIETIENLIANGVNISYLSNQNIADKILDTILHNKDDIAFNCYIQTFFKLNEGETTDIVFQSDKIKDIIVTTDYDFDSIMFITTTQYINDEIYSLFLHSYHSQENKSHSDIFANIIKSGTYTNLSNLILRKLIMNLNYSEKISSFNSKAINMIIDKIAEYVNINDSFQETIVSILRYQTNRLDSPTLLKLINNVPSYFFSERDLFPITIYQIVDLDMILAMTDGLRNQNPNVNELRKLIYKFCDIHIYNKNNGDYEYKRNMDNTEIGLKRIFIEYETRLNQLEDDHKAVENIYREFRQRIKIKNNNYKIDLKEKNYFVSELSQLIKENTFTLHSFNTILNKMNGDLLKTDVLEQFIYNNTQNDNLVNFSKSILKQILNITIDGIKNDNNIYIVKNNCIKIILNFTLTQQLDSTDIISIINLFTLKGKEIGIHNIDTIFHNINYLNANITDKNLKNILKQVVCTKNERLKYKGVIKYDAYPLFDFNDIEEQLKKNQPQKEKIELEKIEKEIAFEQQIALEQQKILEEQRIKLETLEKRKEEIIEKVELKKIEIGGREIEQEHINAVDKIFNRIELFRSIEELLNLEVEKLNINKVNMNSKKIFLIKKV